MPGGTTKRGRARPSPEGHPGVIASRLAVLGLATMMLVLPSFALWGVYASYRDGADAITASQVSELLTRDGDLSAAAVARASALASLSHQAATQTRFMIATPLVFLFGMGFVVLFGSVLHTYRREVVAALRREAAAGQARERRFRTLVQNALDMLLICAEDGAIHFQTPAAEAVWGFPPDGLRGIAFTDLVHPSDQPALRALWAQLRLAAGDTQGCEVRLRDAANQWRHAQVILTNLLLEPGVNGIVATVRDVTQRKDFEGQLVHQACHDTLTGLPNRALLHDRVEQALRRAARREERVGLLFIDLDNFKLVNDSLGHQCGDELLIEAARRIRSCLRAEDLVARQGGDEFVVLLENLATEADGLQASERIAREFDLPFQLRRQGSVITASIGIALSGPGVQSADALLCNADAAMYRAKSNGKGCHVVFEPVMQADSLQRLTLENDLRRAVLHGDEMIVYYQPIRNLASGRITEVEALVRWRHPSRGLVSPLDFIPIAEQTGLIVPLGQWVLEQACRQTVAWHEHFADAPPLIVSVNLSPRQFRQASLLEGIESALVQSGLDPRCLKLEITEGMVMRDVDSTIASLKRLKALGTQIAVDDFGTGYSSLAYLKRLPLDVLKIDRAFINGIGENVEDTAIVRAILVLAHALNLSVTAEGIETAEQARLLQEWGCESGQGYYFSRPVEPASITSLLASVPTPQAAVPAPAMADAHPELARRQREAELLAQAKW